MIIDLKHVNNCTNNMKILKKNYPVIVIFGKVNFSSKCDFILYCISKKSEIFLPNMKMNGNLKCELFCFSELNIN